MGLWVCSVFLLGRIWHGEVRGSGEEGKRLKSVSARLVEILGLRSGSRS